MLCKLNGCVLRVPLASKWAGFVAIVAIVGLGGCTTSPGGRYPEPIPGSITYGGQPRTKLTKSPIGSWFHHRFTDQFGRTVQETYVIQPDRSLLLTRRVVLEDVFDF
ncbi:hypothetical protein SAMN05892877_105219 [Rhizobium subbaraonis]|uniref:Uncharacterized protein n=1 Tax=Rhizobium subbaraonis TaxID=908946 RepID=A0A285UAD1_9HYPH|nr:hypothetical protein [Rhizobium subbaraonis]SOC38703.1 hypothetical protein SAMN05892877_105219 [Rhizobium subbaraonis]